MSRTGMEGTLGCKLASSNDSEFTMSLLHFRIVAFATNDPPNFGGEHHKRTGRCTRRRRGEFRAKPVGGSDGGVLLQVFPQIR